MINNCNTQYVYNINESYSSQCYQIGKLGWIPLLNHNLNATFTEAFYGLHSLRLGT